MTEVKGIELPGVGVRYEFVTEEGKRGGVVSHRSGRREIYLADGDDPDCFEHVLGLSEKDARTLAEVLGASRVAEELAELHQQIERRSPEFGTKIPCWGVVTVVWGAEKPGRYRRSRHQEEVCHADRQRSSREGSESG
jgi:hypothetical protein